jgi:hypothetical protein
MARAKDEAYEIQLRFLLNRIESAPDYYRRLGISTTASGDQIREAYIRAMRLHPRSWVAGRIAEDLRARAERAFGRLVEAFMTLSDGPRRIAYDRILRDSESKPISTPAPPPTAPGATAGAPGVASRPLAVATAVHVTTTEIEPVAEVAPPRLVKPVPVNRREVERITLRLPTRVTGFTHERERWTESVKTADVSVGGVALFLARRVHAGQVLFLQLPLPDRLRRTSTPGRLYDVFAIVRHVDPAMRGERCVGVEFIGQAPPAGFLANPAGEFDLDRPALGDRRSEPRFDINLTFGVRFIGEVGELRGETVGYSENISRRGARLRLVAPLDDIDVIELTTPDRTFVTEAVVRRTFRHDDGQDRACLQFLDACFPLKYYGCPE